MNRRDIPFVPFENPPLAREPQLLHHRFDTLVAPKPELPFVIRLEELRAGDDTGLHQHDDFCTLNFVRGGEGVHVVAGQGYNVMSGDVFIMSPGDTHAYRKYQGVQLCSLYFRLESLTQAETAALRAGSMWRLLASSRRDIKQQPRRLHLLPEQYREAEALVADIHEEAGNPPAGRILARYGLFRLLILLSRWYEARLRQRIETAASPATQSGLQRHAVTLKEIISLCDSGFQEPLTVKHLAGRMFLSPSQFTHLFTRTVGMPPATYLRQLRLAYARQLLATTALKNEEIAKACGLRDGDQLARAFRQAFGMTPSAYRRAQGSKA